MDGCGRLQLDCQRPSRERADHPSGLSLNNAYEELNGVKGGKSDFDAQDIATWKEILPILTAASDSGKVNTFYAVWSFGKAVDMDLLEEWLQLIERVCEERKSPLEHHS